MDEAERIFTRHFACTPNIRATAPACVDVASSPSCTYFLGLDDGVVAVGRRTLDTRVSVVFACSSVVSHRLYGGRRVERRTDVDVRSVACDPAIASPNACDARKRIILALIAHHNPEAQDDPTAFHDAPPPCGFEAVVLSAVPPSDALGFGAGARAALGLVVQAVCSVHGTATELLSDVLLQPSVAGDGSGGFDLVEQRRCLATCSSGGACAARVGSGADCCADRSVSLLDVELLPLPSPLCVLICVLGGVDADVDADADAADAAAAPSAAAAAAGGSCAAPHFDAERVAALMNAERVRGRALRALARVARRVRGVLGVRGAPLTADEADAAFGAQRGTVALTALVRADALGALRSVLAKAAHPRPCLFAAASGRAAAAALVETSRVGDDRAGRRSAATASRFERYALGALGLALGVVACSAGLKWYVLKRVGERERTTKS